MCTANCIIFGVKNLTSEEVENRTVIEIGSLDENGSLRPLIEVLKPASYVGVDIKGGPGVDVICDAEKIIEKFGRESFDIVLSTELIEHVRDWKKVISNLKNICKPNGKILITTRSRGFPYHGFPYDFWRYDASDLKHIFSDFSIKKLEIETLDPGVFIKALKPADFVEKDLSDYRLYSIMLNREAGTITEEDIENFKKRYARREFIRRIAKRYIFKAY